MVEVLRDNLELTDFMESLSHVKNDKTQLRVDEVEEFKILVNFINNFLGISDAEKAKAYVLYLINDLKIFSLLSLASQELREEKIKDKRFFTDGKKAKA